MERSSIVIQRVEYQTAGRLVEYGHWMIAPNGAVVHRCLVLLFWQCRSKEWLDSVLDCHLQSSENICRGTIIGLILKARATPDFPQYTVHRQRFSHPILSVPIRRHESASFRKWPLHAPRRKTDGLNNSFVQFLAMTVRGATLSDPHDGQGRRPAAEWHGLAGVPTSVPLTQEETQNCGRSYT